LFEGCFSGGPRSCPAGSNHLCLPGPLLRSCSHSCTTWTRRIRQHPPGIQMEARAHPRMQSAACCVVARGSFATKPGSTTPRHACPKGQQKYSRTTRRMMRHSAMSTSFGQEAYRCGWNPGRSFERRMIPSWTRRPPPRRRPRQPASESLGSARQSLRGLPAMPPSCRRNTWPRT